MYNLNAVDLGGVASKDVAGLRRWSSGHGVGREGEREKGSCSARAEADVCGLSKPEREAHFLYRALP